MLSSRDFTACTLKSYVITVLKTGSLTILVKSIGNTNINTLAKNYCQYQYQYFYRQYFFYLLINHRCI